MIIAIDGSEANKTMRVGSSEYAYQLINALYRMSLSDKDRCKYIILLNSEKCDQLPDANDHWKYEVLPSSGLWMMKKIIPRLVFDKNIDVFFSPTHYLPIITSIPQICTIHDLGYLMFSEQFRRYDFWQLKYWTAISVIISRYIIAVSDSTRNDIVRHYPFASDKVKTVYHGVDHQLFNKNVSQILVRHVKNKYKIRKNYILSIGTLKPSKNIEGIIKTFSDLLKNNEELFDDYQLVIAGRKGWLYEKIFQYVSDEKLTDKVIFTDYVNTDEKRGLYKGAKLLISPSFWEGFGMHVLESMACGTPVVISKVGSLSEVAGKSGIYVDPESIENMSEGILKVVRLGNSEYNIISESCIKQAEGFTWKKTAEETYDIFKKVSKYENR